MINSDLHLHSGYAGGVGNVKIPQLLETMPKKGIDVAGTGDCICPRWLETLKKFKEEKGLLVHPENEKIKFLLQTEIILSTPHKKGKKLTHTIIFFPDIETAEKAVSLFKKWGEKVGIGRPYLKTTSLSDTENKLLKIRELGDTEIIPAHIMTPTGVYGSRRPVNSLSEVYGEYTEHINCVETGLSADPGILSLIPELDNLTFISNSDAHSYALNRLGREFTTLNASLSYDSIINAVRKGKVEALAEFHPSEGRYYLSGHKPDHFFWPPAPDKCPKCGKKIIKGVLDRAIIVGDAQGEKRKMSSERNFFHMVPLSEVIAVSLGMSSSRAKTVRTLYDKIIEIFGTECSLWLEKKGKVRKGLEDISPEVREGIMKVKEDDFDFYPPGFAGLYGELRLGKGEKNG